MNNTGCIEVCISQYCISNISFIPVKKHLPILKPATVNSRHYKSLPKPEAFFLLTLLFLLFYALFLAFAPYIHQQKTIDTSTINPWVAVWMTETDGKEFFVMTLAFPVYLLAAYFIGTRLQPIIGFLSNKRLHYLYFITVALVFIINFIFKENVKLITILIIVLAVWILTHVILYLSTLHFSRWFVSGVLLVLLSLISLLVNTPPSIFDYGFLIGPANKILQGETPGTFYMQYNALSTFFVALLQLFKLDIHFIFAAFAFVFAIWILLYQRLVHQVFEHTKIATLFILALIIVRCFAVSDGPINQPQVSPLRMDLWVPLVLIVIRFGFQSAVTALCFSLMYLADDVFGLMYLGLYLCIWTAENIFNKNFFSIKKLVFVIPVLLVLLIHWCLFHSISSASGKIYASLHIGFLPISPSSSFWFIAWFIPLCLLILMSSGKQKTLVAFAFGVVCIQLSYFFGRSHDNNLLNISGIFVFVLFWTFDVLYASAKNKVSLNWLILLLACITVNYRTAIVEKWELAVSKIHNDTLFKANPIDVEISEKQKILQSLNTNKVLIISAYDCYVNYRMGYQQLGYFSPFAAHIYVDETVYFLREHIKMGYRVIIFPSSRYQMATDILALSSKGKKQFTLSQLSADVWEVASIEP